jgi:hypothetical protein
MAAPVVVMEWTPTVLMMGTAPVGPDVKAVSEVWET